MKLDGGVVVWGYGLLLLLFYFLLLDRFPWLGIPFGKTLANELCKIKDNLDATEDGESREDGSSNQTKCSLQGECEVVFNLVVSCASNANHHNLQLVRQNPL